jgi:hypothetical protein
MGRGMEAKPRQKRPAGPKKQRGGEIISFLFLKSDFKLFSKGVSIQFEFGFKTACMQKHVPILMMDFNSTKVNIPTFVCSHNCKNKSNLAIFERMQNFGCYNTPARGRSFGPPRVEECNKDVTLSW